MTSERYDPSSKSGVSSARGEGVQPSPVQQTVFDEFCASIDSKVNHVLGMTNNLRAKIDRISGAVPPEIAKERGEDQPQAGIPRTFQMLDDLHSRLASLEQEIGRLDSIAGM